MRMPSHPLLRRLRQDQSGLALIEFAYSLPVLLALTLGGLEVANLAITHMKLSQLAMLVADNASRVRASIDEADINEIVSGAALSANGLNFAANGKIFLSDLEPNRQDAPNTGQYIRWQRCYGSGSFTSTYGTTGNGASDASMVDGMGPTNRKISAGNGTAVMFVEVTYKYQPLISNSIFGEKTIRYTSAFNVRERTDQAMKNAGNLSTSQTATCS